MISFVFLSPLVVVTSLVNWLKLTKQVIILFNLKESEKDPL